MRVGEAEHQQVLHRLLAEVVVDAEDLPLVGRPRASRALSARAPTRGRGRTASRPRCARTGRRSRSARPAARGSSAISGKNSGGRREVVEAVARGSHRCVELLQQGRQPGERRGIVEAPRHVAQPSREALPDRLVGDLDPAVGVDAGADVGAELVVGHLGSGDSHDRRLGRQQALERQVEQGRPQLALGQITRRTQDDDDRRGRRPGQARCRIEAGATCLRSRSSALRRHHLTFKLNVRYTRGCPGLITLRPRRSSPRSAIASAVIPTAPSAPAPAQKRRTCRFR